MKNVNRQNCTVKNVKRKQQVSNKLLLLLASDVFCQLLFHEVNHLIFFLARQMNRIERLFVSPRDMCLTRRGLKHV